MKFLSVNVGHITNSSSVVYSFPKEILENKEIQAILEAYSIPDNMIGSNPWDRGDCHSFVSTEEGWEILHDKFTADSFYENFIPDHGGPGDVVFVYGDEYVEKIPWLMIVLDIFINMAEKESIPYSQGDYN